MKHRNLMADPRFRIPGRLRPIGAERGRASGIDTEHMAASISQLIDESRVLLPLASTAKEGVIGEITAFLVRAAGREDLEGTILEGIWEREREISTGIGRGIAIPHAEIGADIETTAVIGIAPGGVDFDALDSRPVSIVFLLVVSHGNRQERLGILKSLSALFGDAEVRRALRKAASEAEVVRIIRESEGSG
ncbi:MAG: PTS sugar transporter subunit IIA [Candidatus Eisenbacteria bacterium]